MKLSLSISIWSELKHAYIHFFVLCPWSGDSGSNLKHVTLCTVQLKSCSILPRKRSYNKKMEAIQGAFCTH